MIAGANPALLEQIREEVERVEAELAEQVTSCVRLVDHVGRHTLTAGGKRLRPAFVSLAARATARPFDPARARKIGAAMEMIHMATLVHDDVIDHAATRRGQATASSIHGNTAAILSGDVLLAKAMAILAQDGDLEIIRMTSQAVVEIAEGEVRELECRGRFDLDEAEHLEVLRMKTASFIQCCCEAGALIAGADREERRALGTYGRHVGMAFQVVDDLLDYQSDATGKPRAADFREGQATLPLIYLRASLDAAEEAQTRARFGSGATEPEIEELVGWMRLRGALSRAESAARAQGDAALAALQPLPDAPARELLAQVVEFVLRRKS